MKNSLNKTVRKASLFWRELEKVLLNIENVFNSRHWIEDDIEFPILTPNVLITGQNSSLPDENPEIENKDLQKRFKYIRKCKDIAWARWRKKCIKAMREKHNMKTKDLMPLANVGEVEIIESDDWSKGKWTFGTTTDVFPGSDGTVRTAQVKTSKSYLERAVQHLYPLKLTYDITWNIGSQKNKVVETADKNWMSRQQNSDRRDT